MFYCRYFVADANELPYHTKFLLIASFLASYNVAKTDEKYFSEVYINVWIPYMYVCTSLCVSHLAKRSEDKTKWSF